MARIQLVLMLCAAMQPLRSVDAEPPGEQVRKPPPTSLRIVATRKEAKKETPLEVFASDEIVIDADFKPPRT